MMTERDLPELRALVAARFEQSMSVPEAFFAAEAEQIAQACWSMARRFYQGGRLLAFGNGSSATDAQHVSVEFVHPVIVGKRALPALALTNDSATLSSQGGSHAESPFVRQINVLARPQDIAMGFSTAGLDLNVAAALRAARSRGLLTLALLGGNDNAALKKIEVDYSFIVQTDDPLVIQETHETLYHVLWELVHIFFEHEGLLT